MIIKVHVDGFKSLDKFEIDLHPGLNVLVGPNGGGKTNIVLFFEFLSYLVRSDVLESISRVGGVGSIFRRLDENKFEETISATIYGCHQRDTNHFLFYKYAFKIFFSADLETVLFSDQALSLKFTTSFINSKNIEDNDGNWDLSIVQSFAENFTPHVKIDAFNSKIIRFPLAGRPAVKDATKRKQVANLIERVSSATETLLFVLPRYDPMFIPIIEDMVGGETYNIIPSRVRMPEDSSRGSGIDKDGSGLASTLYALDRQKRKTLSYLPYRLYYLRRRHKSDVSLSTLLKYINLVNTSIESIDVKNDPFSNKLQVTLTLKNGEYKGEFPLTEMSDGTLKWMALITAIHTASSTISIEEPENYLHPSMQAEILNILRSVHERKQRYSFTVMTTHSETILNNCRPEELIVVSLQDGRTQARRCSNVDILKDEITKTGFGLGYYYLAGVVEDV